MPREDRRRHRRFNSLNLLSYIVIDRKGQVVTQGVGRTLNVSLRGVALETHIAINPDHTVSLFIALEDDLIDVTGKIVHSNVDENGKYKTGITFENLDATATELLARFIQRYEESNAD